MLPIDTLSEWAEALLLARGVDSHALYAAVRFDGRGGVPSEGYLLLAEEPILYRLTRGAGEDGGELEDIPLSELSAPYIDSLLSSCRLLAKRRQEDGESCTVELAEGSAVLRDRVFVFLAVLEARLAGERMTGEEPLFDGLGREEGPPPRRRGSILHFASLFSPFRLLLLLTVLLTLLEAAIDLTRPYLSGTFLFDEIIAEGGAHHNEGALFLCISLLLGLTLLRFLCMLVRHAANRYMIHGASRTLREAMFKNLQKMSLSYYNATSIGRLHYSLSADSTRVTGFIAPTLSMLIGTLEFFAVGVLLFLLNWRLSLLILLPIPLIVLIYRRVFPHLRRLNGRAARENSAVSTRINDSLMGIRVVKAFSKEKEECQSLEKRLARLYRVNMQANLLSAVIGPLVALIIYLVNQTIWGVGGIFVMEGGLTYGEFSTYLGYVGMVFSPLHLFSSYAMLVGETAESAARVESVLDAIPDVRESESPVTLPSLRGDIAFRDVSFHYTPSRPILSGLSFEIRAGEHIGLVGHTGCGKSTIANLLLRLYDVTNGSITIDGVDVRSLSQETLRRHIAIVSQEIHLFIGTIRENIAYGRPEATDEEVMEAARTAGAHDFIMALPEGYDTLVGRGGSTSLSGGERQRISIARALVVRPEILILDEATAAMDNETERRISEALSALIRGRTTLSIAHRLSTLRGCDRIMAVEDGRLAEMGTRQELLALPGGVFQRLYSLQNEQMQQVLKGETAHGED